MSSKKKYDLVAKIGEYEQNGEKKARWFTCGVVVENEKGQLRAKVNGIPVGQEWDGWLTLSPINEQRASNGAATASEKPAAPKTEVKEKINEPSEDKDPDNLPF